MDPAVVVAFVIAVGLWIVALRRAGRDAHLVGIIYVPALAIGLLVMWAGIKVIGSSLLVGLIIVAIGGVTTVLVARMTLSKPDAASQLVSNGELSGPYFDYIIWIALGLPALIVLALAILAITGALTPR